MAETLHCHSCGGDSPSDARFCIDCGATFSAAAIGPTTRLAGITCPACKTNNPEQAQFCVVCGRSLRDNAPPPQPARARPAVRPSAPPAAPRQSYPRMATPPNLMPARPAPPTPHRAGPRHDPGMIIFLIGLVVLLANNALWPGILLLLGVSNLAHQSAIGRQDRGIPPLLWLGGLTVLFATGLFWPGIFILFFLSMMLGGWGRHHGGFW